MVRKLHIQENVVSDMYGLKIINMNDTKQYLQNYTYDINLEDCSLVPIDKPRTYATAKKSEFPILGVGDNYSVYVGGRERYKRGKAVVGIYGNDYFISVAGDDKIRSNFESCEEFYKVVPNDIDAYQSRHSIAKDRTHTALTKLDDTGRIDDSSKNTLHKSRAFTTYDIDAYNPETNRKRYVDILTRNHLDKFVDDYNDACTTVKAFQNRLNNIDITTVSDYSYGYALDSFKKLISTLKSLNRHIEDIRKGANNTWYHPTESDIERDIDDFDKIAIELHKKLDSLEKSSGVSESFKKKIRTEAYDSEFGSDELERFAKNDIRKFADCILQEITDMGWMDDIVGDFDTADEGWELLVDETCQNLLKDPQSVIGSIEDLVENGYPVNNADDFIYLINKYYVR